MIKQLHPRYTLAKKNREPRRREAPARDHEDLAQKSSCLTRPFAMRDGISTANHGPICSREASTHQKARIHKQAMGADTKPTHPERHRMCDPKVRHIARPKRAEMRVETNFPSSVHLLRLAVELRQGELGCRRRVTDRKVELKVEFIFEKFMHVPNLFDVKCQRWSEAGAVYCFVAHLARPTGAHWVRLDSEPFVPRLLIHFLVLLRTHRTPLRRAITTA